MSGSSRAAGAIPRKRPPLPRRRASTRARLTRERNRGEPIAAWAGARTAEAIAPAIEPDDRYPERRPPKRRGRRRSETRKGIARLRTRGMSKPIAASGNLDLRSLARETWPARLEGAGAATDAGRVRFA